MTVHEIVGAAGEWSVTLSPELPDEILKKLGFFGHIVIVRGKVDVDQTSASLLSKARYVGVFRDVDRTDQRTLSGPGMVTWLGDEDEKGAVFEAPVTLTNATLTAAITALLPSAVHLGTIYPLADPTARYSGSFQFQTPRSAIQSVCDAFGVEFRVNGDGTIDVGRQDQLYMAVPDSIIVRKGAGTDLDLVALGGTFDVRNSGVDYSSRVLLLGQKTGDGTTPDVVFATGSADAPSNPYVDLFGNPIKRTRMISESGTPVGSVFVRAQLQINRFARTTSALKVTAEDFHISGNFRCGDNTFVYDPETGIVNAANERTFRGEVLHPDIVRVTEVNWPVSEDHTVAFRTGAGEWIDLTRYVMWETGTTDLVVGDLAKSLVNTDSNPVLQRVTDALKDGRTPGVPTSLALSTSSTISPQGVNTGVVTASWAAPGTYTDGSALGSVDHYVIRYRWQGRAPNWQYLLTSDLTIDLPVALGLPYDVGVAAVSAAGVYSAYTATQTITTAVDSVAPPAPADPVVTSYLGQLRIEYAGTSSTGVAMPPDTNRVDVHVGTTSTFAWDATTRVSSLDPFAKGVAYATGPYSATNNRWVLLVAYDNTGNASPISARVGGHTVQVADGDVASLNVGKLTAGTMSADVTVSGRFATALTGARVEMNSSGFQKFDSSGNLLVSITGTTALLTGTYKSALTGRRIEIGASGAGGTISLISPDGSVNTLDSFTSTAGVEAIRLKAPRSNASSISDAWNTISVGNDGYVFAIGDTNVHYYGGAASTGSYQVFYASNRGTSSTSPTTVLRFYMDSDRRTQFGFPGTNQNVVLTSDTGDRSGTVAMGHNVGGYGGMLQYVADSSDGHTGFRIVTRDVGDTIYLPLWASSFVVSSSAAGKSSISEFSGDALSLVRSTKVKTYRREGPTGVDREIPGNPGEKPKVIKGGGKAPLGRVEMGLIAEEAPAEIVVSDEIGAGTPMIDLYAKTSLLWKAVQELADRLDGKGKP